MPILSRIYIKVIICNIFEENRKLNAYIRYLRKTQNKLGKISSYLTDYLLIFSQFSHN